MVGTAVRLRPSARRGSGNENWRQRDSESASSFEVTDRCRRSKADCISDQSGSTIVVMSTDADAATEVIALSGPLAERDRKALDDWCPMEHALTFIGTHSAMVLLREAFCGVRRFDDLARRAGITEQIAATRLRQLVEAGLLTKTPYREPGKRTRYEYVLTDRGRDLFPVLVSLIEFGRLLQGKSKALELFHGEGCGAPIQASVRCANGHEVAIGDTVARLTRAGKPSAR